MLDFLGYLKDFEKEDVSKTELIIKEKWDKTISVIKEAFGEKYTNKTYAIHKIQNEFTKKTPESIDANFLKENMNYIVNKIETLSEGEIKIIINNDVNKSGSCAPATPSTPVVVTGGGMDIEMESAAKGRGRPKKVIEEPKTETTETETTITVTDENINTDEDASVLEERRKAKAKKDAEDKKSKKDADKDKKEDIVKEEQQTIETKKEDIPMKKDNVITWKDIEGINIEKTNESTLPTVKAKDKIVVDGKTYQVERSEEHTSELQSRAV
jgi:hypothetical protein